MEKLEILYEDNDILVCNKPAGIAVQSSSVTMPDMETLLRNQLLRSSVNKDKKADIFVVHRLDQPVEGIIVFARNKKAAAVLSSQVQSGGDMNKTYLAVVHGVFPEDEKQGTLRDFIYKDAKTKCAVVVKPDNTTLSGNNNCTKNTKNNTSNNSPKECLLSYKVLSENQSEGISLVEVHLQTGRFHQIRAQFSNAGHPLLGDRKYCTEQSDELSKKLGIRNVALCAYSLSLKHPVSHKEMSFDIKPSGSIFQSF